MIVEINKAFEKDIQKIHDKKLSNLLSKVIEKLEECSGFEEIPNLKKMIGFKNYYRIRVGSHRLGVKLEGEVIILFRFMDRKDIYKYFP